VVEGWRRADPAAVNAVDERDQLFQSLKAWLPPDGQVGYIQSTNWPHPDAIRDFYLATYALAPRRVVMGVAPEFVLVPPEARIDADVGISDFKSRDPRLEGFLLVKSDPSGARVFRRAR
jgi:hypothetical protein